jgi:putative transposase
MDSQSAKTTDKGKSVGMTLTRVKVHEVDIHDKEGVKLLLIPLVGVFPRMANRGVAGWVEARLGWELKVVKHWWSGVKWCGCHRGKNLLLPSGFHVLSKSWVVERTLAWLGRNRRLSKDY